MNEDRPLSLAVWRYDRTQALYDGRIGVPGYRLDMVDAPVEDLFRRAFTKAEFDVSELSFSNYLRLSLVGKCSYMALPVFPSRSFRHGVFYVREDGPVRTPADLVGRRVGVREYSMTAALAARGALRDQYGVRAEDIGWVMGDVDEKDRDVIVPPQLFKPVRIEVARDGALLGDMLRDGRIDAILAYKPVEAFKRGEGVRRLITDHSRAEADYFRQTGIFPIMHLIGIRKDVLAAHPDLPGKLVRAFAAAQSIADDDLRTEQALKISLPWIGEELRRTIAIMGENIWPVGLEANRKVLTRMVEWSYEDGIIERKPAIEDLFLDAA